MAKPKCYYWAIDYVNGRSKSRFVEKSRDEVAKLIIEHRKNSSTSHFMSTCVYYEDDCKQYCLEAFGEADTYLVEYVGKELNKVHL